ncbi:hypothetical protein A9Q86_09940 [Flavobacteriales bacterium 33_180_T64]|nr:hypothetical protein A9Q86_09940 [Flavobacteriales bacterium 33_180_T64]
MPKWGIHSLILEKALEKLDSVENNEITDHLNDIKANKDMALLGSIGPDLFFFSPDYEAVDKIFQLYKNIEKVIAPFKKIANTIKEIKDTVTEPVDAIIGSMVPNTVELIQLAKEEIEETINVFSSLVRTGLLTGVVEGANIVTDAAGWNKATGKFFDEFLPGMQTNKPETDWYWFDMLHYRKTGEFAKNLVEIASIGTPKQRAYAYGYLSHITGDVVGHAYVNQVVGGPYRLASQRHVVVESFMDVSAIFKHDGTSVNATLKDRLKFPENFEHLDDEVIDLLFDAFKETYTEPNSHPQLVNVTKNGDSFTQDSGYLSKQQIKDTYEICYKILDITKSMTLERPTEPFPNALEFLDSVLGDFLEHFTNPPEIDFSAGSCSWSDALSFGVTSDSRRCYTEAFENLDDFIKQIAETIQWGLNSIFALIDLLSSALLVMSLEVLFAILYRIQLQMYDLYQTLRHTLALEGFITPEPEDLNNSHEENLTLPKLDPREPISYPIFRDKSKSHLTITFDGSEKPKTRPDFYPRFITTLNSFIFDTPFNFDALKLYAESDEIKDTVKLYQGSLRIGNAVDFTSWVIENAIDESAAEDIKKIVYTNWNLDADRGYGYKTWEGDVPKDKNDQQSSVVNEIFLDS